MFLVRSAFVFVGMTARAGIRVTRVRVRNVLIVILVTGSTADVRSMVSGVVTVASMGEVDRRPALGRMADVAFLRGGKMTA